MNSMTLKQYLEETGESQTAFARKVNSTQSTVCRWLSGQITPSPAAIRAIVNATGGKVQPAVWFLSSEEDAA